MIIAMIPARMGSQRLEKKNLKPLAGVPLIVRAIRKCREVPLFDEVWVNSEHPDFGEVAAEEGVNFHLRPPELGSNTATSEQFIAEFLEKHPCDRLFQVHSIAPLMTAREVEAFVRGMVESGVDTQLPYVAERIECALGGRPVNFSFERKTNSQELEPLQRITWSVTGWRRESYLAAAREGGNATYSGRIGFFEISRLAGHIIKTAEDLSIAEALWPLVSGEPG